MILIKIYERFCLGLVDAHANLFQFRDSCVVYMLKGEVLEEKCRILIIELLDVNCCLILVFWGCFRYESSGY